jgi:RNA polymerase sigma-70 factor (ECF subfamily)
MSITLTESLLKQAAAGNRAAYDELLVTHFYRLYDYLLRTERLPQTEIEDFCQDIFTRLWDKKEILPTIHSLERYLKKAGRHAALDYRKKEALRQQMDHNYCCCRETTGNNAEEQLIYKQGYELAGKTIAALPFREKEIFTRHTEQGLSFDEIGSALGLSASRTKFLYYSVKAKIKTILEKNGLLMVAWLLLSDDLLQLL